MIDRVSASSAGIAGQGYVGATGGGPVYMSGRVEIVSLERNFRGSSSKDQGNGTISLFISRLGQ
jgi:hypothetical protein